MERTGGEPDVVGFNEKTEIYLYDCSKESPWDEEIAAMIARSGYEN